MSLQHHQSESQAFTDGYLLANARYADNDPINTLCDVLRQAQVIANEPVQQIAFVWRDTAGVWQIAREQEAVPNRIHVTTEAVLTVDSRGDVGIVR